MLYCHHDNPIVKIICKRVKGNRMSAKKTTKTHTTLNLFEDTSEFGKLYARYVKRVSFSALIDGYLQAEMEAYVLEHPNWREEFQAIADESE